jgi:TolB-like protein/Flp pilus assembly protein TadD
MTGSAPSKRDQSALLAKYPDFADRLPSISEALKHGDIVSYTQWEAWLALYHRKPLIIAKPREGAILLGPNYAPTADSRAAQVQHQALLKAEGRYPGCVFTSPADLAKQIAYTVILDLLVEERAKGTIEPGRPRLSIAVKPFVNLGGDTEQENFVDGVTKGLTDELSRMTGSLVIAHSTSFNEYKGKASDARQIGRELDVLYVLDGDIQFSGSKMRVNVRLVDAKRGNQLWSDRVEKRRAELFEIQDEIVSRLAHALDVELVSQEARRAAQMPNVDSLALYYQGLDSFRRGFTLDSLKKAHEFFDRASTLDPQNVDALAYKAMTDGVIAVQFYTSESRARLAGAEVAATDALSLAPGHAWAHCALGVALGMTNRAERGIAALQRSLELNRNLASAHAQIGLMELFVGRAEESVSHVEQAMRISPRDTYSFVWLTTAGIASSHLGQHSEAIKWLQKSIEANRNNKTAHFQLAAALVHLGRLDEARAAVTAGLAIQPGFTISLHRITTNLISDNAIFRTHRDQTLKALCKAGVPDGG